LPETIFNQSEITVKSMAASGARRVLKVIKQLAPEFSHRRPSCSP